MEKRFNRESGKDDMTIVIVGHVDHGKSTIIGRLLADTNSLPKGKLEQVKELCRKNSKPFEYAFLLDALKDEQAQGITIDSARCFFKTAKRNYIVIDAPGHTEFLKNMISGASRAEAALLVIDASEGIQENTRRHGYILSMLGIKQVVVLVNKMDLINYCENTYDGIVSGYTEFLQEVVITPRLFIPVSGFTGDNIAVPSGMMPWYNKQTVLEALDEFLPEELPKDKPFRMPVQDVYKFTLNGDSRRIIAGMVESGNISIGEEIIFYPSGKKARVKSIEAFNKKAETNISVGYATGFTLTEEIYIKRGEIAAIVGQPAPKVTTRIKASLFWLGREPMEKGKQYLLKLGTSKASAKIEEVSKLIDTSNLQSKKGSTIHRHDISECILKLDKAIAFDIAEDIIQTSRFVIVDNYEISGGGIIVEALPDKQSWVRDKVAIRNNKWEKGEITDIERIERYNQKPTLILVTGPQNVDRKAIAKSLEKQLFNDSKIVYFLGIGNVLYGVDADIKLGADNNKQEHLRRLAEISYLLLDAGVIVIVTAIELSQDDLEIIKTVINPEKIQVVWAGKDITTDIALNLHISEYTHVEKAVNDIKGHLQENGIVC